MMVIYFHLFQVYSMKSDKNELREKAFIALVKRRDEIREIKKKIPWRKLETPIQDGWELSFRLTAEAMRRKDGERMLQALQMCDKGFTLRKGNNEKVSAIRKLEKFNDIKPLFTNTTSLGVVYYNGPHLSHITEKQFKELEEGVTKFFTRTETVTTSRWGGQKFTNVKYLINIPEYYICIRIKKRMLNAVQDIDTELLKEEDFIDDKLEEYYRTHGGKSSWTSYEQYMKKRQRRVHSKVGIKQYLKGEIDNPIDNKKLNKVK